MAQGAERGGVGLLDGRSGHGSICSDLFVSLGLFVRYGYSKSSKFVVNTRSSKRGGSKFGNSQCESVG